MRTKRLTPRNIVANRLLDMGYRLHDDEIRVVPGGKWKTYGDILECWAINCEDKEGNKVEITSGSTLTNCARNGFDLVRNDRNVSELYGDFVVEERPRKVKVKGVAKSDRHESIGNA